MNVIPAILNECSVLIMVVTCQLPIPVSLL